MTMINVPRSESDIKPDFNHPNWRIQPGNVMLYFCCDSGPLHTRMDLDDIKWMMDDPKGFWSVTRPVQITPEILQQIGFIHMNNRYVFAPEGSGTLLEITMGARSPEFVWTDFRKQEHRRQLPWLHDLQNLCRVLFFHDIDVTNLID